MSSIVNDFWAENVARDLASYYAFGKDYNQLSDDQRSMVTGNSSNAQSGLVRMCSFHPAYGYEDFLEGYRPKTVGDQLVFERHGGIFKNICTEAQAKQEHKYFLIIDEINRGDIPRIFGELLSVMEKDKRGKSVLLSVSGDRFQVPDNIFIIGTMNTADRSIALLDTALRRRFGFIELMPDIDVLENAVIESIPIGPWLASLNANICEHIGRDARNLQVGHAYLFDKSKPVSTFSRFARIVQDDIIPLVQEYCYEDYATLAKILGKGLVDEKRQRFHHELFEPDKKDDLVQALKAIDPNLDASAQAITSIVGVDEDLEEDEDEETAE